MVELNPKSEIKYFTSSAQITFIVCQLLLPYL